MNNTLKKVLISAVAASALATTAFGGSSVVAPTTYKTGAGYLDSYTAPMRDHTISIQELSSAGYSTGSGYFTVKLNKYTNLEVNGTATSGTLPTSLLGTSAAPINIFENNQSSALHLDVNSTYNPAIIKVFLDSTTTTSDANSTYFGTSKSGYAKLLKYSTLGESNSTDDGNVTVGKLYYDSTTGETVMTFAVSSSTSTIDLINLDLNLSVDANVTGVDMSLAISNGDANGANGIGVTATTVKLWDVIKQPAVMKYSNNALTTNITTADNQPIKDINISLVAPWNEASGSLAVGQGITSDSNITITLLNAVWSSDVNSTDGNITNGGATPSAFTYLSGSNKVDQNVTFKTVTTANDTINIELNSSDDNTSVNIVDLSNSGGATLINSTGSSTGTTVTATVKGTGLLSHLNIASIEVAKVIADGATVIESEGNASKYMAKTVVPGRLEQSLADLNISENFTSTFVAGKTVTVTLPTGYTFSSAPFAQNFTYNSAATGADNNITSAIGQNSFSVTFGATDGAASLAATSAKQILKLSSMKVNVPTSATDAEVVAVTIGGTLFSSSVTASTTTYNLGTVSSTTAALAELNATTPSISTGTSTVDGFIAVDINETFTGQLTAGSNITFTLSDGSFSGTSGTCAAITGAVVTSGVASALSTDQCSGSGSTDGNVTITYRINNPSTTAASGLTFKLPAVNYTSVTTPKAITATVAGTAGVSGTIKMGTTAYGSTTKANTIVAATKGDVDVKTGEFEIAEGIADGLKTTTGAAFKIIAPVGISFTGGYVTSYKVQNSTSTGIFTTYQTTTQTAGTAVSTTFNTNDTLTMTVNSAWLGSYVDTVRIKPLVNVNTTAVDGIQSFRIADVNSSGIIAATGLQNLYVGTIPTLTAAADATVAAAGTTSVVPTNATGTVTYASADTAIATVDAAGTVTVDVNATAAATVVITATDSLTAQAASTTITVGTPAPVLLSGDITLAAGWNFVSAPFDGSIDIATIAAAGCSQVHLADSTTGFWGAAVTTGTATPGQGVAAYCAAAGTASYTGVTPAATAFAMATNITATGSTAVPSTHAAYAVGANFKVVGTPTATTFADVITAGATGVMYYNGTAFDLSSEYTSAGFTGVADNAAQTIPAGASFYIQTK